MKCIQKHNNLFKFEGNEADNLFLLKNLVMKNLLKENLSAMVDTETKYIDWFVVLLKIIKVSVYWFKDLFEIVKKWRMIKEVFVTF